MSAEAEIQNIKGLALRIAEEAVRIGEEAVSIRHAAEKVLSADDTTTSVNLKSIRKFAGIKKQELAERMGVTVADIDFMEAMLPRQIEMLRQEVEAKGATLRVEVVFREVRFTLGAT
jgi:hypothetical protein